MKDRSMAKLTRKQRAKLPPRDFGLPEKARSSEARKETGNYPMPDKSHAISAKRLSRQQRKAANLTKDEFDRINRKADTILEAEGGT
jgi:trimethylamine:corrinoid methyltransferase-like protein